MRTTIRPAVALVLSVAVSGCSLLFVRPAPPRPVWDNVQWAQCTQSNAWPVIDLIFTVSGVLGTVVPMIAENDPSDPFTDSNGGSTNPVLVSNVLTTLGFAFSTYYGFKHTSNCSAFYYRQMQLRSQPPRYSPQQAPQPPPTYQPQTAPQPAPNSAQPPASPDDSPGDAGIMEPPK